MDKALDLRIRGREVESRYGQEYFILQFAFFILGFRSLQPELARANEINHNIHLANTCFRNRFARKNMAAVSCV